jgi:hypothetical protein
MYDNSRMYDNSEIHGYSRLYGNSEMRGCSRMHGNSEMHGDGIATHPSHIVCADMVGDECSCLTVHPDTEIGIRVNRGCFSGTVEEFLDTVAEKPKNNPWRKLYPQILCGLVSTVAKMLKLYPISEVPMYKVEESIKILEQAAERITDAMPSM